MGDVDIYGLLHGMPANCVPDYVRALQDKILEIERKKQELLAQLPPPADPTDQSASARFIVALSGFLQGKVPVPSIQVWCLLLILLDTH